MSRDGKIVAIFGPDGSGKSTVADGLEKILRDKHLESTRYHWRPKVIGSASRTLSHNEISNPDNQEARSRLKSIALHFLYYFDFLLAYHLKFRWEKKKNKTIIYERYFYDILFHPNRYRVQSLANLGGLLSKILPSPDIIILLFGSPSIIRSRKPELSIQEIDRQQTVMRHQLCKYRNYQQIDVTKYDATEITYQIFNSIEKLNS